MNEKKTVNEELSEHLEEISKCLHGSAPLLVVALTLSLKVVKQQCSVIQIVLAEQLIRKYSEELEVKVTKNL